MESIHKAIIIIGIPSSGKTTFARNMRDIFDIPIIETDYIYFRIADILQINNIKSFPNCDEWWKTDVKKMEFQKDKEYQKVLSEINGDIIIEGFQMAFRQDREIIKKYLPNHKIIFLYKYVNYHQWLTQKNNHCTKLDSERTKNEYENLMNMIQMDDEFIQL